MSATLKDFTADVKDKLKLKDIASNVKDKIKSAFDKIGKRDLEDFKINAVAEEKSSNRSSDNGPWLSTIDQCKKRATPGFTVNDIWMQQMQHQM
ncbi:hypothetical protein RRG08_000428 [Elysia crispata]|uniref:Uncharacterized protein n=1 Tax=Elysia crispata TaxID=231223 RepID=A0AAE1CWP7_9GAST|nr:hypothetical protein RRG08_000428 [Elysia crispata]